MYSPGMYIVLAGSRGSLQVVLKTEDWSIAKDEAGCQARDLGKIVILMSTFPEPKIHWQTD